MSTPPKGFRDLYIPTKSTATLEAWLKKKAESHNFNQSNVNKVGIGNQSGKPKELHIVEIAHMPWAISVVDHDLEQRTWYVHDTSPDGEITSDHADVEALEYPIKYSSIDLGSLGEPDNLMTVKGGELFATAKCTSETNDTLAHIAFVALCTMIGADPNWMKNEYAEENFGSDKLPLLENAWWCMYFGTKTN